MWTRNQTIYEVILLFLYHRIIIYMQKIALIYLLASYSKYLFID